MNVARLILVTFLISHCVHTAIAQDCMEAARKAKEWMSKYGTYEFTQDGPTVGIELEGILPRHFTYTDLRDGVKNAFKEQLSSQLGVTQIEVIDGTDHRGNTKALLRYVKGGHTYTWEFKHDYSVESKDVGMQDIEIASPVLRNKEDFDFYFSVIDFLKSKFGLQAEPYTGGVHVHIGFDQASIGEFIILMKFFNHIENKLRQRFLISRQRQSYIQPFETWLLDLFFVDDPLNELNLDKFIKMQNHLYRTLNLAAIEKFGTVEFRIFNSTVDARSLGLIVRFSAAIVKAVRSKNEKVIELLSKQDHEFDFRQMSEAVGISLGPDEEKVLRALKEELRVAWWRRTNSYIKDAVRTGGIAGAATAALSILGYALASGLASLF